MKKVLILTRAFDGGGTETAMLSLVQALIREEYQVKIIKRKRIIPQKGDVFVVSPREGMYYCGVVVNAGDGISDTYSAVVFILDKEYESMCEKYTYARPFTKESLLYREIFETYYPGQAQMIADYWMPNREWKGCNVKDPSARVLSNYGDSGK